MRRLPPVRRVLKWLGGLVVLLLVAVDVTSSRYSYAGVGGSHVFLRVAGGRVLFALMSEEGFEVLTASYTEPPLRLGVYRTDYSARSRRPYALMAGGMAVIVDTPIWLCTVLLAIPTALLWWCDRRRRPGEGCCQECGYNLTGNVSGRCPECGSLLPSGSPASSA